VTNVYEDVQEDVKEKEAKASYRGPKASDQSFVYVRFVGALDCFNSAELILHLGTRIETEDTHIYSQIEQQRAI